MDPEPLFTRDEAVAIVYAVGKINQHVAQIWLLLEEVLGGEEGPEDENR